MHHFLHQKAKQIQAPGKKSLKILDSNVKNNIRIYLEKNKEAKKLSRK